MSRQADPGRWSRVRELFLAVCDVAPDERDAALARACPDDPGLRAEVRSLLLSSDAAPALLETPAAKLFPELRVEAPESLVGRRIDAYVIVRVIASGGMGTVYLAERADQQFHRRVAIKLVRPGMLDEHMLRRFRDERQTLAGLDHPNIARLLDGGVTDDGRPYLVMEYVDGVPIDVYCDERRLNTLQRLRLFREVCRAVEYAHQNLIVHRDLKPGNILVAPDGTPKLLDFGIAKVLGDGPARAARPETAPEQRLLTPEYASPEQIRGDAVTTASDVYSLGVILYELLTGHRPYRLRSRSLYEAQRAILEQEPLPPSTAVGTVVEVPVADDAPPRTLTPESVSRTREGDATRLRRRLTGDIDAIVLTALRKEPAHRYASVGRLVEDLERYLRGLPVAARHGSLAYRVRKFARRHALAVIATAAVAAALLAGVAGIGWQARIAGRQRDVALLAQRRAEREAENARVEAAKTERVITFLQKMISAVDPGQAGRDIRVRELLEQASQRVGLEFGGDPEVESAIHSTLGETYVALGLYQRGEEHLRRALEIQIAIHGGDHPDVARSLVRLGTALYAKGDYPESERYCERALTMHQALFGEAHVDVALDLNNLGALARARGDYDRAERLLRRALQIRRELLGDRDPSVAETLNNLGNLMRVRGDLAQAESLARESLDIRRTALGERHVETIQSISNLGVILAQGQRYDDAQALLGQAVSLYRSVSGPEHPDLAHALHNLAGLHFVRGNFAAAESAAREAHAIRRKMLPQGDERTDSSLLLLARSLIGLGRFDEAESILVEAFTQARERFGPQHERTAAVAATLVRLYQAWERPQRAAAYQATSAPASGASADPDGG